MTGGPHVIPFLPTWIPEYVDVNAVRADVGDDGVSAPAGDVPGLREVVAEAKQKGIDLKVVVVEKNPHIDTPLRDIATEVGKSYPGSTVLVLSPSDSGTYSTAFDRVTLEAGQDVAENRDPVQGAKNFVSQLNTPDFPWTAMTVVLTVGVAAAVVVTRALQLWARRTPAEAPADASTNAEG